MGRSAHHDGGAGASRRRLEHDHDGGTGHDHQHGAAGHDHQHGRTGHDDHHHGRSVPQQPDPACGPFRFDAKPGADRPMTARVTVEPAAPVAGQAMVFHIALTDPDGVSYDGTTFNFGNSGIGGSTPGPCAKFGPWDPPVRDPASATKTLDVTHTYFDAGSYTATFFFDAGPFDCVDSVTGGGDRPYASSATATVTVVVGLTT